jgi:hypothetical protein
MNEKTISTRGRIWFEALAGKQAKQVPSVSSVLVADTTLQKERVRFLAIVPDPNNRFPCARQGQVGLQEGWNLAKQVRDAIKADKTAKSEHSLPSLMCPAKPMAGARNYSASFWQRRRQRMLTSLLD